MDKQKTDNNNLSEEYGFFDDYESSDVSALCENCDETDLYEDYKKVCEEIRRTNEELLNLFEQDIANLSPQTIRRHLNNVYFYLNRYLLYEEPLFMQDGVKRAYDFFGNFFIRKCTWSTPASIKSTAASIKKFYKSMVNHGMISKSEYALFCDDIATGMEDWQADCEQFNDPDAPNPFFMF